MLTAREVADLLGVHVKTVLRWTREGRLPTVRLPGGQLRYRKADIEDWIEERRTL